MYLWIYCKPLWEIGVLAFLAILVWTFGAIFAKNKRIWQILNGVIGAFLFLMILYKLLLERTPSGERVLYLEPFHFFRTGNLNEEYGRMLVMNTFLFFPFGLCLSMALPKKIPLALRVLITVLVGVIYSIWGETTQYFTGRGTAETDDVIFNSVGMLIGTIPIILEHIILKHGLKEKMIAFIKEGSKSTTI